MKFGSPSHSYVIVGVCEREERRERINDMQTKRSNGIWNSIIPVACLWERFPELVHLRTKQDYSARIE